MGSYFEKELAISGHTKDPAIVMKTIANRYIGHNPPFGASYYAYQKTGIRQDDNYRFVFNFHEIYPDSPLESNVYAWAKLWSDDDMAMSFEIRCFGPVIIYCNGERVFKPNIYYERTSDASAGFTVNLKRGWNSIVLRFIRTNTGCGGLLGAVSSRHRPLSFIVPSSDREGQKGWIYTSPLKTPIEKLPETGMSENETGVKWFPEKDWTDAEKSYGQMRRMYSICKDCFSFGWTKLSAEKTGDYTIKGTHDGSIRIYLDNQQIYHSSGSGEFNFKTAIKYGEHNILVKNECGNGEWGFSLTCMDGDTVIPLLNPINAVGVNETWLYAGPFDGSADIGPPGVYSLDMPFNGTGEKVYWRLDKPETVIRPYNANKLFGQWNYPLGVTLYGLIEAGRLLRDQDIINYVVKHLELSIKFFQYSMWDKEQYGAASMHNLLTTISTLDDCGSFGSLMLEASPELINSVYTIIADYIANFIENVLERMPDGAVCRANPNFPLMDRTIWADDLYMCIPFLCRYYKMTGDPRYIDDAAKQLVLFHKYLFRPDRKILSHVYDIKHERPTEVSWGRGNGWAAFSYTELLAFLPYEHPLREEIIRNFNVLCEGYIELQDETGMWHQVLNDHESYPEASCTSMFACAFARGVRNGWLIGPEKYIKSVKKAWEALCDQVIDREGNIYGICRGSGFSFSADYYKNDLGWVLNDTHGIGIVLLAGVEYMKLNKKYQRLNDIDNVKL